MISYQLYKLVHFLGIFMLLVSIGGLLLHRISGGTGQHPWRRQAMITHGVGLFLVLLGGFGMLARMGLVSGLPGWIYGKLVIWLVLGVLVVVIRFKPAMARGLWWGTVGLGVGAAYLAINKPF